MPQGLSLPPRAILDGFRDVRGLDTCTALRAAQCRCARFTGQVGNRPGELEDAVVGPRAELHLARVISYCEPAQ